MSELLHKVAKFGGTSMAQPLLVAEIVKKQKDVDAIVVSAPGKAEGYGVKMTDQLILLAGLAINMYTGTSRQEFDDLSTAIIDRFDQLYSLIDENKRRQLRALARGCFSKIINQANIENYTMSLGEELSARYFTALLESMGMSAQYVDPRDWVAFDESGNLERLTTVNKFSILAEQAGAVGDIIVTPGFYGLDELGNRYLLGRGGSDRTGALAAVGLSRIYGDDKVVYENWTDQDGVKTADPRIVPNAKVIETLTRKEIREGANGGSGVLQGDTIRDLRGTELRVYVRNTFNSKHSGTGIVVNREINENEPVIAISGKSLKVITIEDMGMAEQTGYVEDILEIIRAAGVSFEHMPTAHDALSITFSGCLSDELVVSLVDSIKNVICNKYGGCDAEVSWANQGVVYLVGEAMRDPVCSTYVIGRVANCLKEKGFLSLVDHHNSPCLALLVGEGLLEDYVRILHKEFILQD